MEENKDEEHLDNTAEPQSENISDEITPPENIDSINPNQEIANMEVHKHPHHVTHKKKWGEYVLEFLMIFLAVFLGFVAENIRENIVDRHREKEYIESFIEDLKTDSSSLSEAITSIQRNKTMIDSLMYLLSNPGLNLSGNDLYFYARFVTKVNFFKSNDRTIAQLKNSGGLRLIRNQQASNSIMSYQQLLESLEINKEIEEKETAFLYPYLSRLFDSAVFESMVDNNGNINRPMNNPSLRSVNQEEIKEFMFYLHQKKTSYIFTIDFLNNLHAKAVNLIRFLQQEYQVK
jgi:hypothetical protein